MAANGNDKSQEFEDFCVLHSFAGHDVNRIKELFCTNKLAVSDERIHPVTNTHLDARRQPGFESSLMTDQCRDSSQEPPKESGLATKADSVVKKEPLSESGSTTDTDSVTKKEPIANSGSATDTDSVAQNEPPSAPGLTTDTESVTKQQPPEKCGSTTDTESAAKQEISTEPGSTTDTESAAKKEISTESGSTTDTESAAKQLEISTEPGSTTDTESATKQEISTESGSTTDTESAAKQEISTESGSTTDTESAAKQEISTESGSNTDTENVVKQEISTEPGSNTDTEGVVKQGPPAKPGSTTISEGVTEQKTPTESGSVTETESIAKQEPPAEPSSSTKSDQFTRPQPPPESGSATNVCGKVWPHANSGSVSDKANNDSQAFQLETQGNKALDKTDSKCSSSVAEHLQESFAGSKLTRHHTEEGRTKQEIIKTEDAESPAETSSGEAEESLFHLQQAANGNEDSQVDKGTKICASETDICGGQVSPFHIDSQELKGDGDTKMGSLNCSARESKEVTQGTTGFSEESYQNPLAVSQLAQGQCETNEQTCRESSDRFQSKEAEHSYALVSDRGERMEYGESSRCLRFNIKEAVTMLMFKEFGFKEQCEQRFSNIGLKVDIHSEPGHILMRTSVKGSSVNSTLKRCVVNFVTQNTSVCSLGGDHISKKILCSKTGREFIMNELREKGVKHVLHEVSGSFQVYCLHKDEGVCTNIIQRATCCQTFEVDDQGAEQQIRKLIHSEFSMLAGARERVNSETYPLVMHVTARSDVAEALFGRVQHFASSSNNQSSAQDFGQKFSQASCGIGNLSSSGQRMTQSQGAAESRTDLPVDQQNRKSSALHKGGGHPENRSATPAALSRSSGNGNPACHGPLSMEPHCILIDGQQHVQYSSSNRPQNKTGEQGLRFSGRAPDGDGVQTCFSDQSYSPRNDQDADVLDVPDLISKILASNENIQRDLMFELSQQNVNLSGPHLKKGIVTVLHAAEGSQQKVGTLLNKLFRTEDLAQFAGDKMLEKVVDVCKRYPKQSVFDKEYATMVYHLDIKEHIEPVLCALRFCTISVPVPGYLLSCGHIITADLKEHLQQKLSPTVEFDALKLTSDSVGQPLLTATVQRLFAAEARKEMISFLEKWEYREVRIDTSMGNFLQSKRGEELITDVEDKFPCKIHVQTPEHRMLLHAWSPQGFQLMVYQGDIAAADTDVLVLPFCDGQKEWPVMHKHILDRAFLSTSIRSIGRSIGSEVDQKKLLELQSNDEQAKKKVILMAVPATTHNLFKERLRKSLGEAFDAVTPGSTVALSLTFSGDKNVSKTAKMVLHAAVEKMAKGKTADVIELKLYFDRGTSADLNSTCTHMDKHLTEKKWATSGCSERDCPDDRGVQLVVGEILGVEADVLVNPTDTKLSHQKGNVSKTLRNSAGADLTKQCQQKYPKGLTSTNIAVTDGFRVKKFREIFHILPPQSTWEEMQGDPWHENDALDMLRGRMLSCLALASAKEFQSIVFPTLCTGVLGYPPDRVARTMFMAVKYFFKEMPCSSLRHVFICCYHKNEEVLKAFKAEECAHMFGANKMWSIGNAKEALLTGAKGAHAKKGQSAIRIIEGSALTFTDAADVLICTNACKKEEHSDDLKLQNCKMIDKPAKTMSIIKETLSCAKEMSTVLINLETFDPKLFSDVVRGIVQGSAKQTLHVVLVVPDQSKFDILLPALQKEWKQTVFYKDGETVKGDLGHQENDTVESAAVTIQILGQKMHVQAAFQRLMEERGSSSVDPEPDKNHEIEAGSGVGRKGSTKNAQDSGVYTFTIPINCLEKDDMSQLTESELSETSEVLEESITFCFQDIQDCLSVVKRVRDIVCDLKNRDSSDFHKPSLQFQQQKKDHPEEGITKTLDSVVADALKALMKEDFSQVEEKQIGNDKVNLSCSGPTAENIMNRIDSLRQEEMPLAPEDLQKISAPIDTTEEGVAAYMVPVPQQGKVIIFSFDYNAVSRAKHLLNVKLGKVKVTARARRRFEATGGDGPSSRSPPSPLRHTSPPPNTQDFITKSGIKVSVYKTDITKLPVDAIVNAANEHLAHGGGVAYAIARAAGFDLEDEGQEYLTKNGPLKVREVLATTAGSLPCKKVLHAVGPRWADYKDKALCQQYLVDTVYNCLHKADTMQLTSLAIPSISAAIFGVPKEVCAASYLSAVQNFDKDCGGDTSVRHIHFVDVNDDMINAILETFIQQWNIDMSTKRPEVGMASTPTQSQQVLMSASTGSRSTEHAGSQLPPRYGDAHSSDGKNSSYLAEKSQSTWLEVNRNDKGEAIAFCYHLQDLELLFTCQNVTDLNTDVLVLWQETENIGSDENFRQYKELLRPRAKNILSKATSEMTSAGRVLHVELGARVVIFPVVTSNTAKEADTVQQMVEQCLDKADSFQKASVAIPTHPRTIKDSNLAVTSFAMGVYRAVKTFAERHKWVKKIHIISPDWETIQFITDIVSQQLAMEKSLYDTRPSPGGSRQTEHVADDCVICQDTISKPKLLKCGHTFCTECVDRWLSENSRCPTCKKVYGILIGNQPCDGKMTMQFSSMDIPGHKGCGSLLIDYKFTDGVQTAKHPQPGKRYDRTHRRAYLPNTNEGRTVLMLLKIAFDRRLIFTVGKSSTIHGYVGITWNDIHHKTLPSGGATVHGYPDPAYLTRVTQELADQGVTEEDLTDIQKDFIEKPEMFISGPYDFSHCFKLPSSTGTTV